MYNVLSLNIKLNVPVRNIDRGVCFIKVWFLSLPPSKILAWILFTFTSVSRFFNFFYNSFFVHSFFFFFFLLSLFSSLFFPSFSLSVNFRPWANFTWGAKVRSYSQSPDIDTTYICLHFSEFFEQFGAVDMVLLKTKPSGESRGFAFIRFKDKAVEKKVKF